MSQKKNTSSPSISRSVVKVESSELEAYFAKAVTDRSLRQGEFTLGEAIKRMGLKRTATQNKLKQDLDNGIIGSREANIDGTIRKVYFLLK